MILPTSNILSLNEAFSRKIFPQELWNKIANGKQHFSVLFVKRTTGELRNITHATMNVQKMLDRNPNSQGRSIKMSDFDLLFIRDNSQYDLNGIQGAPRSIPLENIIQIKCGEIYDFKKVNNIPYFFPKFKNATLAKSDSDNIIMVEEKIKDNPKKIKITESQLILIIEKTIIELEKNNICESIIMNENIVDNFKEKLKNGLITTAVVGALLMAPSISAQDKTQIKNIAVKSGIELKGQFSDSLVVVGSSNGTTKEIAKKKAINNAIGSIGENNKNLIGDRDYSVSEIKVIKDVYKNNSDGSFNCTIKCSLKINY